MKISEVMQLLVITRSRVRWDGRQALVEIKMTNGSSPWAKKSPDILIGI